MDFSLLDIVSFAWFIFCWVGYTTFARLSAKRTNTLSSILYRFRKEWVDKLSMTGMSEVDAELLASLEDVRELHLSTRKCRYTVTRPMFFPGQAQVLPP